DVECVAALERNQPGNRAGSAFIENNGAVVQHDAFIQWSGAERPDFERGVAADGDRAVRISELRRGSLNREFPLLNVDVSERGIDDGNRDQRNLVRPGFGDRPGAARGSGIETRGAARVANVPAAGATKRDISRKRHLAQGGNLACAAVDYHAVAAGAGA